MTRKLDLEAQFRDVRKQLQDQLGCLDFRMDSKLTLLNEFQEFFKKRGEVESEYSRSLEKLCERFERNTKQRNIRSEVRSTFNLWSTLLAETRKQSRERSAVAEVWSQEMSARIAIMQGDVSFLTKKCKEMCTEIQEQYLKEIRDFGELTKVYQHSCHNVAEAIEKHARNKEKVESTRESRKKKAEDKEKERQRQYKALCHQLLKNRNDYIMGMTKCNAFSLHYFNRDILELVEYMDYDYHDAFKRLAEAYRIAEKGMCTSILQSADAFVEQARALNFETDLNYFLNEFSQSFHPPSEFQFVQFEGNDVTVYKVNTEDVYSRSNKAVEALTLEKSTLEAQKEEDEKTIRHMKQLNLMKYKVVTVEDAIRLVEENGDTLPLDSSQSRGAPLEKGLSPGAQALQLSQKGKKDTLQFTLGVVQRNLQRSDQLEMINTQLDLLEAALAEQKVKPIPVQTDSHGRTIPGEVPKLFGGDILQYIAATGASIPLIVESCVKAIEKDGLSVEGLFRVPGPSALIDELRKGFEEGRDPLATSKVKIDHTAVASVLKAYFRELPTPLFPTEKYQEFIQCARKEDPTQRLSALQATINTLPHPIVNVMSYLFRFLYRVSLEARDNKMGSANLALVFGPTLTRAPSTMDPRSLHNDVPAVNLLIQLCITLHRKIFGGEEEKLDGEEERSPLSPTAILPTNTLDALEVHREEVCYLPQPSVSAGSVDVADINVAVEADQPREDEQPHPPVATPTTVSVNVAPQPEASVHTPEPDMEKPAAASCGLTTQTSSVSITQEFKSIEETLRSIEGMVKVEEEEEVAKELGDEGTEDSESDAEEDLEDDVLKIECTALYDYAARSDKELSFKKGDQLQVIEKTPDSNWWDGFHEGRRGFIPVSYVEIAELQPTDGTRSLAIPLPPQRKSSMHKEECIELGERVSEVPGEVPIVEERSSTPSSGARIEGETPGADLHPPEPVDKPAEPVDKPAGPVVDKPAGPVDKPVGPVDKPVGPIDKPAGPVDKPVEKPATPVHKGAAVPDKRLEDTEAEPLDKTSVAVVDRPAEQPAREDLLHQEASEEGKREEKATPIDKATSIDKAPPTEKPPPGNQGVKGNVSKLKAQFSGEEAKAELKLESQLGHSRQRSSDGHKLSISESPEDLLRSSSASSGAGNKITGTPEDLSARTFSGGNKSGLPTTPAKAPPTKPKPPPTITPPTTTAPAELPGAFTITSHTAGISPLQRAAAVAAVAAVVTPAKPPPPSKPPAATGGKVKRNGSQKEEVKPAPVKPKAGDKTGDMLRAELQAAVTKGRSATND